MTIEAPAYVISASSHSAALFRQAAQTMLDGAGVSGTNDLQVLQHGAGNLSVDVAAGTLWIPGSLGGTNGMENNITNQATYGLPSTFTAQGSYAAYNDATVNLAIASNSTGSTRNDLVYAAIQDAQYSGVTNTPVLGVTTGAAGGGITNPPASSVVLAQVAVANGASQILTANITDKRPFFTQNVNGIPGARLIDQTEFVIGGSQAGANYIVGGSGVVLGSSGGALGGIWVQGLVPFVAADYTIPGRPSPQLFLRVSISSNATAAGTNIGAGLFTVSAMGGGSAAFTITLTGGAIISQAFAPTAGTMQTSTATAAFPANGTYLIQAIVGGTTAAASVTNVKSQLYVLV